MNRVRAVASVFGLCGSIAACVAHGGTTEEESNLETSELALTNPDGGTAPDRAPRSAPALTLTPIDRLSFPRVRARARAIPVLLFHEICAAMCTGSDTYGVTQLEFMRILLGMQSAGYHSISIADYARAMKGDWTGLPARPILITFDDGRIDGYRGSDDVLRVLGERAVMYVITAAADRGDSSAMSWPEIVAAQASGRWDMQLHAHAGHVRISVDTKPDGGIGPFYAWRRDEPADGGLLTHLENFAEWKERAEGDISKGSERLVAQLGRSPERALSFAVPFGDYGVYQSNDRAIAPAMRAFLDSQFAAWFTQDRPDPDFTTGTKNTHELGRYIISNNKKASTVYAWLSEHAKAP